MRERGVEAVTIQDITDAADLGHGTFYLHFKAKGDVLGPVIERLAAPLHEQVDRAAQGSNDPALRQALGLRILLRAIADDPLWSWYARSGISFGRLSADMGTQPVDDMEYGLQSGRYDVSDLRTAIYFLDGALIGVISELDDGRPVDEVAEAAAALMLRVLGINPSEAAAIAQVPLDMPAATTSEVVDFPSTPTPRD